MIIFVIFIIAIVLTYKLISQLKVVLEHKRKNASEKTIIFYSAFITLLGLIRTLLIAILLFFICISLGVRIEKEIITQFGFNNSDFSLATLGFLILLENIIAHTFIFKRTKRK